MELIGRTREQKLLQSCLESRRPEFLVVYGRRRVGKTYLIREYFNGRFAFYATGISNEKTRMQLRVFGEALQNYGSTEPTIPKDWFEAFGRLKELLQEESVAKDPLSGKKVVFLDELPWMDTARSDFKSALDYFWNSWGSSQEDLLLIVCGSATSWIIENILSDSGGFYNRITRQLHLEPFHLKECEQLLNANGMSMTRRQIMESYMIFGGIPYYLNCFDRRLSLAQNVEELCFQETGQLHFEFHRLFHSLFKNSEKHIAIIRAMAERQYGVTRTELAATEDIGDGQPLTKALLELEQCGFIRKYKNYTREKSGYYYQVIDPFVLFHLRFMENARLSSWLTYLNSPGYYSWGGNAFEVVCLNHIPQLKAALGISGVETMEYAWRSKSKNPGAQVDLLVDRRDDVINLCEMKYTLEPFEIDAPYETQLLTKQQLFREETGTKKAIHLTLVSASGLKQNSHSGVVQTLLTADDLFTE